MRILIADASAPLRDTLRLLLEAHADWEVCAEAAGGLDAIALAKESKPDVVILDLLLSEVDGLAAAQQILQVQPTAGIVLYTMVGVPQLEIEARKYGVQRVIDKSEPEKVIPAIEDLLVAPPPVVTTLPAALLTPADPQPQVEGPAPDVAKDDVV